MKRLQERNRLMISAIDFDEAITYLEAIDHSTSEILHEAAIYAAVIAYCRPFTQNERKGNQATQTVRLSLKRIFTPVERKLHDQIMEFRHKTLAHSEFDYRPARIVGQSDNGWAYCGVPTKHYLDLIPLDQFKALAIKAWQASRIEAHKAWKEVRSSNSISSE